MTEPRRDPQSSAASFVSPYGRGVAAVTIGLLLYLLITAVLFFSLYASPRDWPADRLPAVPAVFWSMLIYAILTGVMLPAIIPLIQRLSKCPVCGKSTLVTSDHLDEWNVRANPDQRTAGGRRFWPERQCSECHADLRLKA